MLTTKRGWLRSGCAAGVLGATVFSTAARADEVWVAPTYQQDIGGLGIGSSGLWPVTAIGAVRLAWAVPNDLLTFQSAKVVLIPNSPGGAANLNIYICPAQNSDVVTGGCAGPFAQAFTGVANHLVEVEIGGILASRIGTPGASYLAVIAYTTPTTATDHIVGLRFGYAPKVPAGTATLAANTFTGTQTAPAFVGDGSGLTNLPFPSGAATLGANTFTGPQNMGGQQITNLASPSAASDAATKAYVDDSAMNAGGGLVFDTSWDSGVSLASGAWHQVPASVVAAATTHGGPLLINMNVSLNGGSHSTCRPLVDGQWAGSYAGYPQAPGDPFWTEGLLATSGGNWHRWNAARIYRGIPAGVHTFSIECATDGGTLTVGSAGGVFSDWNVIEMR